jgi:hypothetical protein
MVKDQDNQRNSEYLNGQKPIFGQKPWDRRSSEMKGLAKSRLKQSLSKVRPRAGSELALIPNETNKVRSHKINPKISGI